MITINPDCLERREGREEGSVWDVKMGTGRAGWGVMKNREGVWCLVKRKMITLECFIVVSSIMEEQQLEMPFRSFAF